MSRIRFRQKKLILAASIGGASVLLLCTIFGFLYVNHIQNKNVSERVVIEQELQDTKKQISEEMVEVAVINEDRISGSKLKSSDVTMKNIPRSAAPEDVVDKTMVNGKYVKISILKNTPITKAMLYEEEVTEDDIRNQEFSLIELPSKLKKDEFVDVRIKFPTGQDYIVLSKKRVEDLKVGTIWYHMNENEILLMSGGIVDAYLNNATIYALSYTDPGVQSKAQVTYPANKDVLDLIDADPNIVNKATTELERRNRVKLEESLNKLTDTQIQNWNSGINNTTTNAIRNQAEANTTNTTNTQQSNDELIYNQGDLNTSNIPQDIIFSDSNEGVQYENGEQP